MKNEINVLKLAWIIFKNKSKTYTFRNALKLAWKMCKTTNVQIVDNTIELLSKTITKLNLSNVTKVKGGVSLPNNEYELNILFYQFNRI